MERLVFMVVYIAFLIKHNKDHPEDHIFLKMVQSIFLALVTTICMFVAAFIIQPILPFFITGVGGYLAYRLCNQVSRD